MTHDSVPSIDGPRLLPEGFECDISLEDHASLETMMETMNIYYRDLPLTNVAVRVPYTIDGCTKLLWLRCQPNDEGAIRTGWFKWRRAVPVIDYDKLAERRKEIFQVYAPRLLAKRREWLPYPMLRPVARFHASTELTP